MCYNVDMQNVTLLKDIQFIKESLKLSESEFSNKVGISRMSFNRWKNDGAKISKDNIEKIYSFAYKSGLRINEIKAQMFLDKQNKITKILFHGAKEAIKGTLCLDHSKENNDFGKAFYVGEDYFQSASFVSNSNDSRVYIIEYNINNSLKTIEYNADENWMHTIAYYRGRLKNINNPKILELIDKSKKADVIIAPIADNQMYSILNDYCNGEITDKQCENSLSATDLGKQYCFMNDKSLKYVKILHECYLCKEEKEHYLSIKNQQSEIGLQKAKYAKREYAGKGKYIDEIL